MSHEGRPRAVLLVDMDAFFASVAIRERPELATVPVIVGGRAGQRGAVASCNYLARQFGVRSAMSLTEAARRCPDATFLPVDRAAVSAASREVAAILAEWSDVVEAASIDEFYLDMTGAERIFGPLAESARAIQQRILDDLQLPCSIGGGTNKLIAKIAADRAKPGGIRVVAAGDEAAFLALLPISVIPGVGPKSAESLRRRAITTCGDVAALDRSTITRLMGSHGPELQERARGRDDRAVRPDRARKQISQERTFLRDTRDRALLHATLQRQAEDLGAKLRREGLAAATVAIKLRWGSWETVTRQTTLRQPADLDESIYAAARELLDALLAERREAVRLLGVAVAGLQPRQASLWSDDERQRRLAAARDAIRERWGRDALLRAQTLRPTAPGEDADEDS
jgi:DNA polymerase IV